MFIFIKPTVLIFLYVIIPLASGILFFVITKKLIITVPVVIFSFFIPLFIIKQLDANRRKKFVVQLIDGLMIVNSCLKAGLTLIQAFETLVDETSPPISQEFSLLVREVKMGVPFEEAIKHLDKRMPSEEMTLISSAILVARETGGDLTKVFVRLIDTIRDRLRLKEMISTFTLQARAQAFIISLLGPLFFIVVRKFRPDHFDIMIQTEIGRVLIVVAIILQILGILFIFLFGRIKL
jgi:tight adherence protein B